VLLNIACLLQTIASLCPESARGEFKEIPHVNGIQVQLEPTHVVKLFPETLFQDAMLHAEKVYKTVLEELNIPNVDHLE